MEGSFLVRIKGKALTNTKAFRGYTMSRRVQLLASATVFCMIVISSYQFRLPAMRVLLDNPLPWTSTPSFVDKKSVFFVCNLLVIILLGDSWMVLRCMPHKKEMWDAFIVKKNEIAVTEMRDAGEEHNSTATKMVSAETDAMEVDEPAEIEGEEEEEDKDAEEMNRKFAEFIARQREKMRTEMLGNIENEK